MLVFSRSLLALFAYIFINTVTLSSAFVNHAPRSVRITPIQLHVKTSPSIEEIKQDSEQLRQEIKELKSEALRRLQALERNVGSTSTKQSESSLRVLDSIEEEGMLPAPPPIVIKSDSKKGKSFGNLLDESVWKVSLSKCFHFPTLTHT